MKILEKETNALILYFVFYRGRSMTMLDPPGYCR